MRVDTLLLLQTHYFDARSERAFRRLQRQAPASFDCRVLIHLPPGAPVPKRLGRVPHHLVRSDELRAMPYPRKIAAADWTGRPWDLWGGGHCDLIPLHAMRALPDHARFWVVEHDVAFTGDWRRFFAVFEDSEADLLSTCVRAHEDDPCWVNWPSLQGIETEGALLGAATAAFLPIFRVSARLFHAMDEAYAAGFGGHLEATWSTLAALRGMKLEDIGGEGRYVAPGNRHRFYTSAHSSAAQFYLAPGTFFAKPAMYRPGSRRGMLWHPVKPWHWREEFRAGLREWRVIAGAKRRECRDWLARLARGGAAG